MKPAWTMLPVLPPPQGAQPGTTGLVVVTVPGAADAATDAEEFDAVVFLQLLDKGQHFLHRLDKGVHRGQLGADVHLNPGQAEILQPAGPGIDAFHLLDGDSELILVGPGGDLGVGLGVHVRVHANGDARGAAHLRGDGGDHVDLLRALGIDLEDVLGERVADFICRLANAGEDDRRGRNPGGAGDAELAFADHVGAKALGREHLDDLPRVLVGAVHLLQARRDDGLHLGLGLGVGSLRPQGIVLGSGLSHLGGAVDIARARQVQPTGFLELRRSFD